MLEKNREDAMFRAGEIRRIIVLSGGRELTDREDAMVVEFAKENEAKP